MMIGRETLTKSSGKPMALPHCSECVKRKGIENVEVIKEFLDGIESKIPFDEEA